MKRLFTLLAFALGACSSQPPSPAVLQTSDDAQAVRTAIADWLGLDAAQVRLDAGRLTTTSLITLERQNRRGLDGVYQGRELSKPPQFRLLKQGSRCLLENVATQETRTLSIACDDPPTGN